MQRREIWPLLLGIILVIIMSGCSWFKKPQQKPEEQAPPPPPPQQTESKEPLPPQVDFSKYKSEPTVSVYMAESGNIVYMPLEQYLEGVVAAELEPDWPLEALKSQAVVARTISLNAIEQKVVQQKRKADVSTDKTELQSYNAKKVNDRVREAVRSTRGQVMTYKGAFVNAIYSSCCGQKTATKIESFPKQMPYDTGYFQAVDCPCFEFAPERVKHWKLDISGEEWKGAIGYQGAVQNIQLLEAGPSGRPIYIGTEGKKEYAAEVRQRLGYDKMLSTAITKLTYENGKVHIEGKGWGNGIGMCQWGAYTWAQKQQDFNYILTHYYQGVTIQKLWE